MNALRFFVFLLPIVAFLDLGGQDEPKPYVRLEAAKDGRRTLQTSWRRLDPPKNSGKPVVWLISVCHVGEKDYFDKIQQKLDEVDLVLFEGVGFDANATAKAKERDSPVSSLQTTLADSLGLVFQLDAINYDRRHFRNSDLGLAELQGRLSGSGNKPKPGNKGNDLQAKVFLKMLKGDSFALTLVQGILKLFQGNPQFRAMARLVIIETIGACEGDVSKLAGAASPTMRRLFKTLIDDRNAVVLRDLRQAIRDKEAPASIAVFYGAGHMIDLEARISEKLGYRSTEEIWVTAFSVNPRKAGLTPFETNLVQRLVRSQLDQMKRVSEGKERKKR
ncbi:MAG: hypothetical protein VCA36_06790 [Opitutales bacterium]